MKRASGGAKVVVDHPINHRLGVVAEAEVDDPMNRALPEVAVDVPLVSGDGRRQQSPWFLTRARAS